jgi:hypothetical protein
MAMRGAKRQLIGNGSDQKLIGRNDVELRVFVRFDPVTLDEVRNWTPFGQSEGVATVPAASTRPADDAGNAMRERLLRQRMDELDSQRNDDGSAVRERLLRRRMEELGQPTTEPARE